MPRRTIVQSPRPQTGAMGMKTPRRLAGIQICNPKGHSDVSGLQKDLFPNGNFVIQAEFPA